MEYAQVYDYDNLYHAAMAALKEKKYRHSIKRFHGKTGERLDEKLIGIQNDLIWKTYRVKPLVERDGGGKLSAALSLRDRIVQIALCTVIQPSLETLYIYDNYAFRKDRGINGALDRLLNFIRYRENKFYLKCRIDNLYGAINTPLLMRIIKGRYIKDEGILWLIETIHECRRPFANDDWLSRLAANAFCAEIDRLIKVKLQTTFYLRYLDEFMVLSDNSMELTDLLDRVELFLFNELNLTLDNDETIIGRVKNGISFLGRDIINNRVVKP